MSYSNNIWHIRSEQPVPVYATAASDVWTGDNTRKNKFDLTGFQIRNSDRALLPHSKLFKVDGGRLPGFEVHDRQQDIRIDREFMNRGWVAGLDIPSDRVIMSGQDSAVKTPNILKQSPSPNMEQVVFVNPPVSRKVSLKKDGEKTVNEEDKEEKYMEESEPSAGAMDVDASTITATTAAATATATADFEAQQRTLENFIRAPISRKIMQLLYENLSIPIIEAIKSQAVLTRTAIENQNLKTAVEEQGRQIGALSSTMQSIQDSIQPVKNLAQVEEKTIQVATVTPTVTPTIDSETLVPFQQAIVDAFGKVPNREVTFPAQFTQVLEGMKTMLDSLQAGLKSTSEESKAQEEIRKLQSDNDRMATSIAELRNQLKNPNVEVQSLVDQLKKFTEQFESFKFFKDAKGDKDDEKEAVAIPTSVSPTLIPTQVFIDRDQFKQLMTTQIQEIVQAVTPSTTKLDDILNTLQNQVQLQKDELGLKLKEMDNRYTLDMRKLRDERVKDKAEQKQESLKFRNIVRNQRDELNLRITEEANRSREAFREIESFVEVEGQKFKAYQEEVRELKNSYSEMQTTLKTLSQSLETQKDSYSKLTTSILKTQDQITSWFEAEQKSRAEQHSLVLTKLGEIGGTLLAEVGTRIGNLTANLSNYETVINTRANEYVSEMDQRMLGQLNRLKNFGGQMNQVLNQITAAVLAEMMKSNQMLQEVVADRNNYFLIGDADIEMIDMTDIQPIATRGSQLLVHAQQKDAMLQSRISTVDPSQSMLYNLFTPEYQSIITDAFLINLDNTAKYWIDHIVQENRMNPANPDLPVGLIPYGAVIVPDRGDPNKLTVGFHGAGDSEDLDIEVKDEEDVDKLVMLSPEAQGWVATANPYLQQIKILFDKVGFKTDVPLQDFLTASALRIERASQSLIGPLLMKLRYAELAGAEEDRAIASRTIDTILESAHRHRETAQVTAAKWSVNPKIPLANAKASFFAGVCNEEFFRNVVTVGYDVLKRIGHGEKTRNACYQTLGAFTKRQNEIQATLKSSVPFLTKEIESVRQLMITNGDNGLGASMQKEVSTDELWVSADKSFTLMANVRKTSGLPLNKISQILNPQREAPTGRYPVLRDYIAISA